MRVAYDDYLAGFKLAGQLTELLLTESGATEIRGRYSCRSLYAHDRLRYKIG